MHFWLLKRGGEDVRLRLGLREAELGLNHLSTLTSMSNLALALNGQGKYDEMEQMHQTLGLKQAELGRKHLDTVTIRINLATALSKQGKYEQLEELLGHCSSLQHC